MTTLSSSLFSMTVPLKAPAVIVSGTAPTGFRLLRDQQSGRRQHGGGSFKLDGSCASGTVILTFATTAPNDWACFRDRRNDGRHHDFSEQHDGLRPQPQGAQIQRDGRERRSDPVQLYRVLTRAA